MGGYQVDLTWASAAFDLDLYLTAEDDTEIGKSTTPNTLSEQLLVELDDGTFYVVEVQAFDSAMSTVDYELRVVPIE